MRWLWASTCLSIHFRGRVFAQQLRDSMSCLVVGDCLAEVSRTQHEKQADEARNRVAPTAREDEEGGETKATDSEDVLAEYSP